MDVDMQDEYAPLPLLMRHLAAAAAAGFQSCAITAGGEGLITCGACGHRWDCRGDCFPVHHRGTTITVGPYQQEVPHRAVCVHFHLIVHPIVAIWVDEDLKVIVMEDDAVGNQQPSARVHTHTHTDAHQSGLVLLVTATAVVFT